ncbi:WbqC family protein [archaeon AH-315-M20]|nr:WbqC family protein [archaeon AH-315-M20]
MTKKAAIHQVNYHPWLGFFNKISQVDCFVLLDTVDYSKNNIINRNKIKVTNGTTYLTIPIEHEFFRKPLLEVLLPKKSDWAKKHWKTIELSYSKADFFDSYNDFFRDVYKNLPEKLVELNENIIRFLLKEFKIDAEIIKASELDIDPELKKTDLLLEILRKVNATSYLSGSGGKGYLEEGKFADIKLEYMNFKHPVYKQLHGDFIEGLAAIDLLFNEGNSSEKFVKGGNNGM